MLGEEIITDPELVAEALDEGEDILNELGEKFVALERNPSDERSLHVIFGVVHTIKGNCAFLGWEATKSLAHALEGLLSLIRNKKTIASPALIDQLLEGVALIKRIFRRLRRGGEELDAVDSVTYNHLMVRLTATDTTQQPDVASCPKLVIDEDTERPEHRSIRINESKIDAFLRSVGDLIVVREMFHNFEAQFRQQITAHNIHTAYRHAMESFESVSHTLQDSIMEIRLVPAKLILQRIPPLVRTVANVRGLDVELEVTGQDVMLDKSLIEALEAPLMHLVRNAIDHGLAGRFCDANVQTAAGTPTLSVTVSEGLDDIRIKIHDNGGGIDTERLRKKAVGLVHDPDGLTEAQARQLIFLPGISTAAQVTDLSGRGVGMDVVKKTVVKLGGQIQISCAKDQGTTFAITIPKSISLQIINGFMFRVENERFILPLSAVKESFQPMKKDVYEIAAYGKAVMRHGATLPLLSFSNVVDLPLSTREPWQDIVVTVELENEKQLGLVVDQVIGLQQIVIRDIEGITSKRDLFSGGAILGDGRIGMVIDVEKLGRLY